MTTEIEVQTPIVPILPKFSVIYDGCVHNIYHANKGEGLPKHEHEYEHLTVVCAGSCLLLKETKQLLADKNTQPVNFIAKEWHSIEAQEDGTVFMNIFSEGKY